MDLNLPGLFRNAYDAALSTQNKSVLILIGESAKDEMIYALNDTLFIQQHSKIGRAAIPCNIEFHGVTFVIEATETLTSDTIIIDGNV